jgi:hypothetical protein
MNANPLPIVRIAHILVIPAGLFHREEGTIFSRVAGRELRSYACAVIPASPGILIRKVI